MFSKPGKLLLLIPFAGVPGKIYAQQKTYYDGSYEMSNWLEGIFGSTGVWVIAIIAAIVIWFILDKKEKK